MLPQSITPMDTVRPLLVCFLSTTGILTNERFYKNCAHIFDNWESRDFPLLFVFVKTGEGVIFTCRGKEWPRPGYLLFECQSDSPLRDQAFRSLDADLGVPPLVLMGIGAEREILATAVDGALDDRQVFVIEDAICTRTPLKRKAMLDTVVRAILSQFATLITTEEILHGHS